MTAKDWLASDGTFLFGKHEGDDVESVAADDPGYLRWILDTVDDISDGDREVIETALRFGSKR